MSVQPSDEPHDDHVYSMVSIYADTFRFLLAALRFYKKLLEQDRDTLNADSELKELLSAEAGDASILERELRRVDRAIAWWEGIETKQGKDEFSYEIGSFSHGVIRFLKSVGLLYLKHLQLKRERIASQPNASKYSLGNIDTALSKYQEKMDTAGVFGKATPIPLLVDEVLSHGKNLQSKLPEIGHEESRPLADATRPKPVLLESIQLLDSALRKRCLDLFADFQETKQHDRFDTVVAEATRILEDRLRAALGVRTGTGDDLANKAFSGSPPRLRVSEVDAEQKAVLLFFKGVFGHIRNPSHHKLLGNLSPERTIQVLGMIDYAIYLVETAEKLPE